MGLGDGDYLDLSGITPGTRAGGGDFAVHFV
jgi:hypothetical protein